MCIPIAIAYQMFYLLSVCPLVLRLHHRSSNIHTHTYTGFADGHLVDPSSFRLMAWPAAMAASFHHGEPPDAGEYEEDDEEDDEDDDEVDDDIIEITSRYRAKTGGGGGGDTTIGGVAGGGTSGAPAPPYKCGRCGRAYQYRKTCNRHMRHECGVGKHFVCNLCGHRTQRSDRLLTHMRSMHPTYAHFFPAKTRTRRNSITAV